MKHAWGQISNPSIHAWGAHRRYQAERRRPLREYNQRNTPTEVLGRAGVDPLFEFQLGVRKIRALTLC